MEKPTDKTVENSQEEEITNQTNTDDNFADDVQDSDDDSMSKYFSSASDDDDDDEFGEENFMEMFEESLKSIQEGELVSGEVVMIGKEHVLVDIGYKSEGQIRIHEFMDAEGVLTTKVGDTVEVLLEKREDDNGRIVLSMEKAAKIKIWDEIKLIYEEDRTVEGEIIARLKGGMAVDIGLQAFLPGSQIDLKPVRNFDALIGTKHDFKILKYNKRRSNIVLSRRAILESERKLKRDQTLTDLAEGSVLKGTVKNITDYGFFIDLGGIDGLLHITDISWGRVGHPSELYQIGDEITVKVLKYDKEKERVSLGLKQLNPDPWINADTDYPVKARVIGKVVSLADYGAFIEIKEGIEGLIHVSEMSWTRKIRHPSQILKVGDAVDAVVLNIDSENKRISLGLKQVEPNPWAVIGEKYPIGTTIEGRIKNITDFGIFIGIDEGIDGLVHISDISWTKRIKHPSEIYKKGEEVQAVVLNIDEDNERFSLGIKQMTIDPWDEIPQRYSPGTRVTGTVTNITDFGVFVELEEGIEGLIHVSELTKDKSGTPLSRFKVDDVIQAKVINITKDDKKIGLSIRKLEESEEKDTYKGYINNGKEATSNLGELLKAGMLDLENKAQAKEEKAVQDEAVSEPAEVDTEAESTKDDAEPESTQDEATPESSEVVAEPEPTKDDVEPESTQDEAVPESSEVDAESEPSKGDVEPESTQDETAPEQTDDETASESSEDDKE